MGEVQLDSGDHRVVHVMMDSDALVEESPLIGSGFHPHGDRSVHPECLPEYTPSIHVYKILKGVAESTRKWRSALVCANFRSSGHDSSNPVSILVCRHFSKTLSVNETAILTSNKYGSITGELRL